MQNKCSTKYCKNKVNSRKFCSKCRTRKHRKNNPLLASYTNLKNNAKRRGVHFDLTIDQFKEFCYQTKYLAGKGRTKESYSIDRIDNTRGYIIENIRVLTVSENARKGAKILQYDYRSGFATVTSVDIQDPGDLPF